MLDALATLPPRARAMVVLRFWQDLSVEQAADMLGCSVGNVKGQSARTLSKLRALLDGAITESGSPGRAQTEQHQTGASEMDETTLRELLDHALIHEPPIGPVAHNALQAGIRLRRQRRLHRIAGSMAAIAVIAAIIPTVTIGSGSAPVPAVSQSHRPTAIPPGGPRGTTMYMVSPHWLTPVATATNTPGKPIKIAGIPGPSGADLVGIAITRDGNTAFAVSSSRGATTIIPIATATNTPGKPIHVGDQGSGAIAITPDGRTAYIASGRDTVIPVALARRAAGSPTRRAR